MEKKLFIKINEKRYNKVEYYKYSKNQECWKERLVVVGLWFKGRDREFS
jgi:hypothetical protein